MSANHAKYFDNRKASAEETARWLVPACHKARDAGSPTVTVPLKDLTEILAYVEAMTHRQKVEFSGKRLGYAQAQAMRDLMSCKRNSIDVLRYPSNTFPVEVFYIELPPKPGRDE